MHYKQINEQSKRERDKEGRREFMSQREGKRGGRREGGKEKKMKKRGRENLPLA